MNKSVFLLVTICLFSINAMAAGEKGLVRKPASGGVVCEPITHKNGASLEAEAKKITQTDMQDAISDRCDTSHSFSVFVKPPTEVYSYDTLFFCCIAK